MAIGGSFDEAITLTPGIPITSYESGRKEMYFKVETDMGFYYEAFTKNSSSDIVMVVYDESRNEFTSDDDSGGNRQPRVEFAPVSGITYIKLWVYGDRDLTSYDIFVNRLDKEVPPPPEPVEEPTFDTAIFIPTDSETEQVLPQAMPKQYFQFFPEIGKRYTIKTIGNEDTVIYIYDANRGELSWDDQSGGGNNASITFTAPTDEMFAYVYLWSEVSYDAYITLSLKSVTSGGGTDPYPLPDGEPVHCARIVVPIRAAIVPGQHE